MELWKLPQSVEFGGKTYEIHADFRDILEIFSYLQNPDLPESFRWTIALALFFKEPIPEQHTLEAAQYLSWFIRFTMFMYNIMVKNAGQRLISKTTKVLIINIGIIKFRHFAYLVHF